MVVRRQVSLLEPQQQQGLESAVSTRIVHRHCLTRSQCCWPAASMLLVASRGRQWCWWLAWVVICRTTSVVLKASRGRQLSYDNGGAGG